MAIASSLNKRRLVRLFVDWTDAWNKEMHDAIEAKVQAEFRSSFPNGIGGGDLEKTDQIVKRMREFYYARMSNTANLLVAVTAVVVSLVALLVSALAFFH
ncbi:hypothetical protein [Burkholderia stagnalis]|uniref:hypothetical protein n=1 Tax=Burkholderia stagnalis TaxID=1503054 RepID=UPI00075FD396|nr:hypothetical protein [Burkholderia stagnalis]KWN65979.1 hypothetical protein WT90_33390 [Burkholderia stagnalis]